MKILCISNFYPPYFEGGYEISVKESMDYLADHKHDVYILCGNRGQTDSPDKLQKPVPNQAIRILKYINYAQASFRDKHRVERFNYDVCCTLIRKLKPDIVYMANMKAISIAPVIAVQKLKQAHVYDLGDIWLKAYLQPGLKSRMFRWLKATLPLMIGGRIDLNPVIVVSNWIKQVVSQNYGSSQIYVVPRGIEIPALNEVEKNLLPNSKDKPLPLRYIFAGRIEPLKGLDIIIKAIALIREKQPEFYFDMDIFGEADPIYAQYCKDLIAKNGLSDSFHWQGHNPKLREILSSYDVMLMPTLAEEAFGRVIIEAMAVRLIVVATDAFGPAEIISTGRDGFLFPRASHTALAEIILQLKQLDAMQIEQLKSNARKTVCDKYEISLVKKQIESILENIVYQNMERKHK